VRTITLRGVGIGTSALGFGTASLMGRLGKRASLRLLARAYDEGIRYFDTAPLYGYGESEAILGIFARHRTDIAIGTKFGLAPRHRPPGFISIAKGVARPLLALAPGISRRVRRIADTALAPVAQFDLSSARSSVSNSLRQLRRTPIDVLLLHDCKIADLANDALLEFLRDTRRRGDVRSFGIATNETTIRYAIEYAPGYADVVQLANNLRERSLEREPSISAHRACITHSPFGGWGKPIEGGSPDPLRYALEMNHDGIVLFSTQNEAHIATNVRAVTESIYP